MSAFRDQNGLSLVLSQIPACCASAHKRLEAVVEAEGGHIGDE